MTNTHHGDKQQITIARPGLRSVSGRKPGFLMITLENEHGFNRITREFAFDPIAGTRD
jgi:hypothetical protein